MKFLEDVVLDGAAQILPSDTSLFRVCEEERHDDDGRRVNRHGHGDFLEIDAFEQHLHIVERIDGDAKPADFAERAWIVGVEAHQRRQIEGGGETGLAFAEEELEAFVGLRRSRSPRTAASSRAASDTSTHARRA